MNKNDLLFYNEYQEFYTMANTSKALEKNGICHEAI